jgi:hypothetical protein
MSLTDDLKKRFADSDPVVVKIEGLPDIFSRSLTLGQIRDIETESDTFSRIARHFQVRAKDADGKPLVRPTEFDDFLRYADADLITDAVGKMQNLDSESFEDTEKKS